jgi:hypothetical protein
MQRIAILICLLLVTAACHAQTPQVTRIDVTEYGEYALEVQSSDQTSAQGIAQRTVNNVKQLQQTRVIHLHNDLHFGFRYTVVGSPIGATVTLRKVVIYPPQGLLQPGKATPIYRDESNLDRTIGDNFYRGYTVNGDWMMVPGNWTFELWYGDRLLTSQTFQLVK